MSKTKDNKTKSGSIKTLILSITTLPMLLACILITFFASWTMNIGMRNQVFEGLKSTSAGALLSLDNVSTESFRIEGEDLYKGDFNLTQNMGAMDYYASSTETEIIFFYGNKAKATTIKDKNNKRVTDFKVDPAVSTAVLKQGEAYTSSDVVINGEHYYGYYMPVSDMSTGELVGMVFAGKSQASVTEYIQVRINFIIIIALLNYISCVIMSVLVSKKEFINPIRKLTDVAKELARGNVNQTITKERNNEFGELTDCFAQLMANIKNQAYVAEKMADGDLTVSYDPVSREDVMGHAIQTMVKDNNQNLTAITNAAERMASGVQEISSASNSLARGTAQQASAVAQITASIEGIADIANVNAEDAKKANNLVKNTREIAVHSNDQMDQMISAMQDINDASENISKIMKIIDDIASQTNIISLNASVEAGRAGVHGKGFAVVAEEIRQLASESAEASKNSATMIENAIQKAEIGSKLASETASSLEQILNSVENLTALIDGIAESSANQSSSVNQVTAGITQIADVLQTNSSTSQQCAAASSELANLADVLRSSVERYRLK